MSALPSPADDARALAAVRRRREGALRWVTMRSVGAGLARVASALDGWGAQARLGALRTAGLAVEMARAADDERLDREVEKLWRDA